MKDARLLRITVHYRPRNRRKTGRPEEKWSDQLSVSESAFSALRTQTRGPTRYCKLQRMHSKNIFYIQFWVKNSPVIPSYNHHTPDDSVTSTHYSDCTPPEIAEREDLAVWCSLSLSLSAKESVQTNSPTAIFKKQHTCIMKIVNRIDVSRLCS